MAELFKDAKHLRGDLQQVERGLRQGWEIPQQIYDVLPHVIANIVAKGTNREKIAAGRLLAVMHKQNNDSQPVIQQHQHQHLHAQVDAIPVTHENMDERKRQLAARIVALGGRTG
jgi:hypothetical protein